MNTLSCFCSKLVLNFVSYQNLFLNSINKNAAFSEFISNKENILDSIERIISQNNTSNGKLIVCNSS